MMEDESFIITGGAGYIGGHLVDYFVNKGANVIVIDDLSKGNYKNPLSKFIKCDLSRKIPNVKAQRPIIFHFAANPDVKTSMEDIKLHYESDVTATLNTMEMARRLDAQRIFFSSSSTVYGLTERSPTKENAELNPISNYGLFKVMGEEMVKYYSNNYGIKSSILRFANVVGGRTTHGATYNFAKNFMKEESVEIWGDGEQRKSYIYISDLISGINFIYQKQSKKMDIFNLGTTDTCSVKDMVEVLSHYTNTKIKSRHVSPQKGDVRQVLLDIKKIKALGWNPKYNSKEALRLAFKDLIG